jgi:two-component system NtrC family sensor kinase
VNLEETMSNRGIVRRFHDWPLRSKLILSFLAVIAMGGIVSLFIGTRLENATIMSQAEAKVRHDLASAWMVYHEKSISIRDVIWLTAHRRFLREALRTGRYDGVAAELEATRRQFDLDILTVTDARGRVVVRTRRPDVTGDDESGDPFVARALDGEGASGTEIVSRAELLKEGPDLAERAYFEFVPTPKAAPRPENHEERGMMLKSASPVEEEDGRLLGTIYGGFLFNRSYELVDQVKDIVFKGEKYKGHDIGTATLFQGDLRISTNVLDDKGNRAVGTRVSREVNEAVLGQGRAYVGRAFVVNAEYITAYEPIRDLDGGIIGMLYVGMLEKPYIDLRNRVMATFAGLAGLCTLFLVVLLAFVARQITRPLAAMVEATDRIARGDLTHRVAIEGSDEIGRLAREFNRMTGDLREARDNLTEWGRTLERRVEERTRELREAQDQLIQSEKLASLGKMAAGVAHEINNPLTSIILNTHLLLEEARDGDETQEPLTLIADEAARCAQIVSGLLNFARQTPATTVRADVNEIVDRTVQLLEKQASVRNIGIERNLDRSLPAIDLDRNKIQQVFSNLTINACEAMPEGGSLRITSRMSRDGTEIIIAFADTGVGIPKENIPKLFDPFFTTKSLGTGLGLAVSYGIVRQRGGTIEVRSEVGRGSTFTVRLPLEEKAGEPEEEEVSS